MANPANPVEKIDAVINQLQKAKLSFLNENTYLRPPLFIAEAAKGMTELQKQFPASNSSVGSSVQKTTGDYKFNGIVVAEFEKLNGDKRLVVENEEGILHIFSEQNLKPKQ